MAHYRLECLIYCIHGISRFHANGDLMKPTVIVYDHTLPLFSLIDVDTIIHVVGFCINKKSYLYPEEALLLSERSVLLVEHEGERVSYHKLYEDVIDLISLECHLAYLKLKSLDYLVFRYGKSVRSFEGDASVFKYLKEHPESSLLKVTYLSYYCMLFRRV